MVPRPLAPARAMISRTCADVIQPCQSGWLQIPTSQNCFLARVRRRYFRRRQTTAGNTSALAG